MSESVSEAKLSGGKPWTTDAAIRSTQVWLPPGMVNFGIGQPGFDLLPLDLVRQAAEHRLSQENPYLLNYGSEQGDGYFRLALADYLSQHYGQEVDPDGLILSAGASQGLDLICTLFTKPGDTVFVEEPTYFLALRIFEDHGLRVTSLPTDSEGLVVGALEDALAKDEAAFLYLIPTFQNPTGVTMSSARRDRLVEAANASNMLVVADEVYHLLSFTNAPPTPLAMRADEAPILSLGSFSKILAPGMRLGWIHGSSQLVERVAHCGLLDSGGSPAQFVSGVARSLLELRLLTPYVNDLKQVYRERYGSLSVALRSTVPEARFDDAWGGFFLWLTLPDDIDTCDLLRFAEQYEVSYVPGVRFSSRDGLRSHMRLSFAFHDSPALVLGVERLRSALDAYGRSS